MESVALGRRNQGDIARATGLTTSALAPHLKNLSALGYLERIFPLMPGKAPRTAVLYRIADPLLRFWFRFIEPHWSTLRRQPADRTFDLIVAPQWEAFCGEGFERMCREALPLLYASEGVVSRFNVGEYWDKTVQIDVVGLRADGWVDLGECRWPGNASLAAAGRELFERAKRYPSGGYTIQQHLFLRKKPSAEIPGLAIHDLKALYQGS